MEQRSRLQGVTRFLAVLTSLAVIFMSGMAAASAQDTGDASQLAGRLGGSLVDMQARFGDPSWTDTGLIGYNSQTLAGVDSIVVVYYDDQNIVDKISLVYLEKPAQFSDPKAVADTVAQVAPMDGTCGAMKLSASNFGSEVYSCNSPALASVFDGSTMAAMQVKGSAGDYSYSIDPTADEYFEIVIQPGTDTNTPPPTAVPTTAPEPTAVPSLSDTYPPVPDVRELAIGRGFTAGDKLSVSGSVFNIEVDSDGTYMQIWVGAPDGSTEPVMIYYEGDSTGVFEGTWVTAYGTYIGPICGTNAFGGQICQPAILADHLEY